jgi:hypothetical protein
MIDELEKLAVETELIFIIVYCRASRKIIIPRRDNIISLINNIGFLMHGIENELVNFSFC